MLTRRQLLARGTTLLALVPVVGPLLGCSSSGGDDGAGGACSGGIDTVSTVDAAHTHTLCIQTSDLTSPPAAGMTYTSSVEGGHSHRVTLTQAQLTSIGGGQTVTVTSSNDVDTINGEAHTHQFAVAKTNTAPPPPPGGGW